jgi:hypothetical protein
MRAARAQHDRGAVVGGAFGTMARLVGLEDEIAGAASFRSSPLTMIRPNVPGRAVSVSSQLLACNVLTSIAGFAASLWPPTRKLPLPLPAAGHACRDLVPVNVTAAPARLAPSHP